MLTALAIAMSPELMAMAVMFGLGGIAGAGPTLYHTRNKQTDDQSGESEENPDGDDEVSSTDEEQPSDTDVKVTVTQTVRELNNTIELQDELEKKYKELIKEGANAKRDTKRAVAASRAKIVKFKMKALELKRATKLKDLIELEVGKVTDDIETLLEDLDGEVKQELPDLSDPSEIQAKIDRLSAEIGDRMGDADEILETDVDTDAVTPDSSEEIQLMDEVANDERDIDDIDVNPNSDVDEASDIVDDDVDIGDFDISQGSTGTT